MRIILFCFVFLSFFISNAKAMFFDKTMEIKLRPYLGLGYALSGNVNTDFGGIRYQSMLPNIFNSFGGHIGVRTNYLMVEFSTYGAIPSKSMTNNGGSYGIASTSMDMITMRITAIATLHAEMFDNRNNLLLMVGMLHAFSNIKYDVSNPALLPNGLQYAVFGTNVEFGIGYMRDITDHFSIRTDFRYSPISISGVTDMMFTWNIGFFGFL
jgi:hypothetical protein